MSARNLSPHYANRRLKLSPSKVQRLHAGGEETLKRDEAGHLASLGAARPDNIIYVAAKADAAKAIDHSTNITTKSPAGLHMMVNRQQIYLTT